MFRALNRVFHLPPFLQMRASNTDGDGRPSTSSINPQTDISRPLRVALAPQIPSITLEQLDSFIEPLTRFRSDHFTDMETKLMLEEIDKRRSIILAENQNPRYIKKAWDDISSCMTRRYPSQFQRKPPQVSKNYTLYKSTKSQI